MVIIVVVLAILLLFQSGAFAGTPLSGVFGTRATPPGRPAAKQVVAGYRFNPGITPSAPILGGQFIGGLLGGLTRTLQTPPSTATGRAGTGLSSAAAAASSLGAGVVGNLNSNATPAPTVLPGFAGLQPSNPQGPFLSNTGDLLAAGYPPGEQPLCLINQCNVAREPCTAYGLSCCVTPYTPPCSNAAGSCYYSGTCLPGYCGPAPVCVGPGCGY